MEGMWIMSNKIKTAIIGPGNIGSDLMYKIKRSRNLELALIAGVVESEGIRRARDMGYRTSTEGVDAVVKDPDITIVFEATGAKVHEMNSPALKRAGKLCIDLTPAAIGPYCVPCVNLDRLGLVDDVNMVTCGGQATIPIVHAIAQAAGAEYAEIVACIASKSAGIGTRQNIDEFTETTAEALVKLGGADTGKAIIILNPAEPPIMMTNTIYVRIKDKNCPFAKIEQAVMDRVKTVQKYVPGYQVRVPPILEGDKVTVIVQVEGAEDYLPQYSGNLDIITSAAVATAEFFAEKLLEKEHTTGKDGV
jgi:acetaldehyde dehydrogenase